MYMYAGTISKEYCSFKPSLGNSERRFKTTIFLVGNDFLRRLPASGVKIPPCIHRVLEYIATNSNSYTYVFGVKLSDGCPVSWHVDVRQKSKMAVELPVSEVPITLLVLQIHVSFQKQYMSL